MVISVQSCANHGKIFNNILFFYFTKKKPDLGDGKSITTVINLTPVLTNQIGDIQTGNGYRSPGFDHRSSEESRSSRLRRHRRHNRNTLNLEHLEPQLSKMKHDLRMMNRVKGTKKYNYYI